MHALYLFILWYFESFYKTIHVKCFIIFKLNIDRKKLFYYLLTLYKMFCLKILKSACVYVTVERNVLNADCNQ